MNMDKYEFFYKRIKSGYYVIYKNGTIINPKGKSIGVINSKGYSMIFAQNTNVDKLQCIGAHAIVWMYFNGRIPSNNVLNHKDGNKLNNSLKNLELVSIAQNNQHASKTGLINVLRGEKKCNALFKDRAVLYWRIRFLRAKETISSIAEKTGTNKHIIYMMIRGKSYSHLCFSSKINIKVEADRNIKINMLKILAKRNINEFDIANKLKINRSTVRRWKKDLGIANTINSKTKLNEDTVLKIRKTYKNNNNVTQAYLAERFKINRRTIGRILSYDTWKHVA